MHTPLPYLDKAVACIYDKIISKLRLMGDTSLYMNKSIRLYGKLFTSTFYLSAFTFGGGYVIIPLMHKKFVEKYRWIEEKEMLDLTAIAQSTPGAMAVNASILIGYRLAGVFGAFVTILGTILPPLIILSVISLFYNEFQENAVIKAILKGMNAGVAAVVADVTVTMGKGIINEKNMFAVLIMIVSFSAVFFFNMDVILIILACAILGLAVTIYGRYKQRGMT